MSSQKTDRISIPALREEHGKEVYLVRTSTLLALVEAVEAAKLVQKLAPRDEDWDRLDAVLARFDFGEET